MIFAMKSVFTTGVRRLAYFPVLLGVTACLLTGCAEEITPDTHTLSVDFENTSGAGIGIGATYDEWALAYGGYHIQEVTDDGLIPYTPDKPVEDREAEGESVTDENRTNEAGTDENRTVVADDGSADQEYIPHTGKYMISAFYIDNEPKSVEELMAETGATADGLSDRLTSPEYLAEHSVMFRYIIFTIEDDIVTDVEGDYLDYNTEL